MGFADAYKRYWQRQQDEQQRVTAQAKFGSASMVCDGTGDYVLGSGDFTVTMEAAAPYERNGPQATDGPTVTVTDVATAVKRLERADKGRTLMAAISKLHQRRQSNGKPVVYVPE